MPLRILIGIQLIIFLCSLAAAAYIWTEIPGLIVEKAKLQEENKALALNIEKLKSDQTKLSDGLADLRAAVVLVNEGLAQQYVDKSAAFKKFGQARQRAPDDPSIVQMIAEIQFSVKRYAEAENFFDANFFEKFPKFSPAYVTLAKVQCAMKKNPAAKETLERAKKIGVEIESAIADDPSFKAYCPAT